MIKVDTKSMKTTKKKKGSCWEWIGEEIQNRFPPVISDVFSVRIIKHSSKFEIFSKFLFKQNRRPCQTSKTEQVTKIDNG